MNLLLDTHALIWFINGDRQLSKRAQLAIEAAENRKFVSIASLWEMSIKVSLGRLKFSMGFQNFLALIEENGFEMMPIGFEHYLMLSKLEYWHRDPFDRLLVAQCLCDQVTLVSKDEAMKPYKVSLLW